MMLWWTYFSRLCLLEQGQSSQMFLKEANTILSIKPSQSMDPNRSFWHGTKSRD